MDLSGKTVATDELSSLVLTLYRAARELPLEEFQTAALTLIKPTLPFDSGWWASGRLTASEIAVHAVHLHDKSPEFLTGYERVKDQDVATSMLLTQGGGIYRFHMPTVYSDKKKSLEVRHFLKNNNIGNLLFCADFKPENGVTHFISLFRGSPDQDYSDRDQYLMQTLLPHLMEALTINRLIHLEHLNGGQRCSQLAIADKRGMLYHAESGFITMLREEFRSPITDRLPTSLMVGLDSTGRYDGKSLVIQCSRSADLLFLKARVRLPVDALSIREANIAQLLAQGLDYKKVSQALNISPATVRSHIKNIYKKLNIINKAQLIVALSDA